MPGECYPFLDEFEICWNVDAQTKKERIDLKHNSGDETSISCFHTVKAELGDGGASTYTSTEDQPEFDLDTCIIGTKSVAQYFSENGLAAFTTQHGVEDLAHVVPWSQQLLPFVAKYNKDAVDLYINTALDECQTYLEPDQCIHARLEPFKDFVPPVIRNEYLLDAEEIAKKMIRDPDFHPKPFQKKLIAQLQILDLRNNKLTSLPESLGQLTQLQKLDLGDNKLTSLPESLGQLGQLQILGLRNNQLTSLPESVGRLDQLWMLNLENNQLTSLPESVGQLVHLRVGQLVHLRGLYLSGNPITKLPRSLCNNHRVYISPSDARQRWCN